MYQNGYGGYPMQGGYQTMANPWQQRLNQMEQQNAPRYDIIRVNGEAGAKSLRMGPNSSTLIQANEMQALRDKIQQLELHDALCGVVRYPLSTTYTSGGNPFCGCNHQQCCNI